MIDLDINSSIDLLTLILVVESVFTANYAYISLSITFNSIL